MTAMTVMQGYDDPVEVRRGALDTPDQPAPPVQLLWRGRLWKVRDVLAHRPEHPDHPEREVWRVRAGRGGLEADRVLDLSLDVADGSWRLVGAR